MGASKAFSVLNTALLLSPSVSYSVCNSAPYNSNKQASLLQKDNSKVFRTHTLLNFRTHRKASSRRDSSCSNSQSLSQSFFFPVQASPYLNSSLSLQIKTIKNLKKFNHPDLFLFPTGHPACTWRGSYQAYFLNLATSAYLKNP